MPSHEVWVGTWRPHKPRGPIAALYGNPGPKYALPGLTGNSRHDPTKSKAPMFSFGNRLESASCDFSPGPIYLIPSNITREGRGGTPAFSLQSRPKEQHVFKFPGPGKYSPEHSEKWLFRSSPSYSLAGRGKELLMSQTPGPAAHSLPPLLGPKTVGKYKAPSYSICGRVKPGTLSETKQTPGPATYRAVDPSTYRQRPPQFSMIGRNYVSGDRTERPGPGAHYPERVTNTRGKAPSFSFGLRHSEYVCPFILDIPE